ncbi:MAG: alpha/beta hydrolase [Pseudomonadota bacterium]
MLATAITVSAALGAGYAGVHYYLRPRESVDSSNDGAWHNGGDGQTPENAHASRLLSDLQRSIHTAPMRQQLAVARQLVDEGIAGTPSYDELGVTVQPVAGEAFDALWVTAESSRPQARLLYLHGGAFALGSATSHRLLIATLAKQAGVAVLAVNYRLMPEHKRTDGIVDCQKAYLWMLENGPNGVSPATHAFVGGDSAGGNLSLMLIAWLRDNGHRQVDRAVAICPNTDATGVSPSLVDNRATDQMLGRGFVGRFVKLPPTLARATIFAVTRLRPDDPLLSPVFGNLADLPPTLIQASDTEMLLDDARRWFTKAKRQGTDARLELYGGMMHVWHMFAHVLPEGVVATDRIAAFIAEAIDD